jgi:hypothetical protein
MYKRPQVYALVSRNFGFIALDGLPTTTTTTQVITTNKIMGLPLDLNAESSRDSLF